jgi:UDPglucose 6-dehydrogenase
MGKLGLPCALTLNVRGGHQVTGYDLTDKATRVLTREIAPPQEEGIAELLDTHSIHMASNMKELIDSSDVVFIAVQTPHGKEYGGEQPMPDTRADFNYTDITQAFRTVVESAVDLSKHITAVVVSTMLPGTIDRILRPINQLHECVTLIYNPFFIAMGTTIFDMTNPEFVLIGCDRPSDVEPLRAVYQSIHDAPWQIMSFSSAELTKVSYNTFISAKIAFTNYVMEVCHKTGADCDDVLNALGNATERVISTKYMRGGMGDGGACHPRDLLAMSWLEDRLDLSTDFIGHLVYVREQQTHWLATLVVEHSDRTGLPIIILGKSYKPGSDLMYGSPALLLAHYIYELTGDHVAKHWDPYIDGTNIGEWKCAVYFIGTNHSDFLSFKFPIGSIVIDPWGMITDSTGITVIRIGRK